MRKTLIYIISFFVAIVTFSCTSDCFVTREARLGISFLDSTTYKAKNITSLTVFGVGSDSILYKNTSASAIYLPLKSNSNVTDYNIVLPTRVEGKDTPDTIILHVEHTPMPQLLSEECGCTMYHIINDVNLVNNTYNFKLTIASRDVINENSTTSSSNKNDNTTQVKILH